MDCIAGNMLAWITQGKWIERMAKAKSKEWYWEAEHDKIAADENLKLIRCDPGDSEGLECVGLWFLMMNLMARSARQGYLVSPADDREPMSATELAVLTGRSAAVVSRLLSIVLQRGLFSKTDDEIIYSRGLVRKAQIRKIRSKSGKKGGLRTQDLLKQTLEQKDKQKLGIVMGIELNSNLNGSAEKPPDDFDEFWHRYPRKIAKGAAKRAWVIACKKVPSDVIIAAVEEFAQSHAGKGDYVKHPATWLNGECWSDDREVWNRISGGKGKTDANLFGSIDRFTKRGDVTLDGTEQN